MSATQIIYAPGCSYETRFYDNDRDWRLLFIVRHYT
jgi:hypothetical protein